MLVNASIPNNLPMYEYNVPNVCSPNKLDNPPTNETPEFTKKISKFTIGAPRYTNKLLKSPVNFSTLPMNINAKNIAAATISISPASLTKLFNPLFLRCLIL